MVGEAEPSIHLLAEHSAFLPGVFSFVFPFIYSTVVIKNL